MTCRYLRGQSHWRLQNKASHLRQPRMQTVGRASTSTCSKITSFPQKLKVAGGYHSSRQMVCRWAARIFAISRGIEQVMHQQFLRILALLTIHTIDWLNSYVSLISQNCSRRSHIIIIHWKSQVRWNWTIECPWFFPTFQQDPPRFSRSSLLAQGLLRQSAWTKWSIIWWMMCDLEKQHYLESVNMFSMGNNQK